MNNRQQQEQEGLHNVDYSLAPLPGRFVRDRRRGSRGRVWTCTLPKVLRDLAPRSSFDPRLVWRKEQERGHPVAPVRRGAAARRIIEENLRRMEQVKNHV